MPVSVLLHLVVVALFFFELPERIAEPQEPESVNVELVPPPEEKKKKLPRRRLRRPRRRNRNLRRHHRPHRRRKM